MTTLEAVRAKVIEAVPEIMEFKAGCILNLNAGESYGYMTIHRLRSLCKKHKKYREECSAEENGCSIEDAVFGTSGTSDDEQWWEHTIKVADIKPYQIVGRPITLADVLRAIEKESGYFILEDGTQHPRELIAMSAAENFLGNYGRVLGSWNLALSLDEQEPEVIEFLAKVLCV